MNNRKFSAGAQMAEALSSVQWQLEALSKNGEQLDEVVDAMPDESIRYVSAYNSSLTVQIKGDVKRLGEVMGTMRRLGYVLNSERPKANKPTWDGHYTHNDKAHYVPVDISFGSTVCRRVQVGTKKTVKEVEEPIYEVQCDEPVQEPEDAATQS